MVRSSFGVKVRAPLASAAPLDPKPLKQHLAHKTWASVFGEDAEVQRGKATCPKSHSTSLGNWYLNC